MRSTYKLALIVLLAFAANVAISHVSATPIIDSPVTVSMPVIMADSAVALWCAPAAHRAVLAVAVVAPVLTEAQDAPVTDTGDSARAGEPVAILDEGNSDVHSMTAPNLCVFRSESKLRYVLTRNTPVTDLEA